MPSPAAPPYDLAAATRHVVGADPRLGLLIERIGPCRMTVFGRTSPFDALLESIVYQQLNGKAAATIYSRLCALFHEKPGRRRPRPPEIAAAPLARLRSAGLSENKARAAQDLAEKTLAGVVPPRAHLHRMSDEEIVDRLTQVRGVGRWTVEMLLIFVLGRPDVLPVDDYGVRKGFARVFRKRTIPTPKALLAHGERWRPYRSVASWYLWKANETAGGRA